MYLSNQQRLLEKRRLYVVDHKIEISDYNKVYYQEVARKNLDKLYSNAKLVRLSLKEKAFLKLGGECVSCKEREIEFLTVDHVNNDGADHRKKLRGAGLSSTDAILREIRDGKETRAYQLLCWNCNFRKIPSTRSDSSRKGVHWERTYREKLRKTVLDRLGTSCACCRIDDVEILTIDHIDGGGSAHRRQVGSWALLRHLRDIEDVSEYQTLCWNCNLSKGFHQVCAHKRKHV